MPIARIEPALLLVGLYLIPGQAVGQSLTCSYHTWEWNTVARQAENYRRVEKMRRELTEEERDQNSKCTVCEEDQVEIKVEKVPPFKACRHVAGKLQSALQKVMKSGWKIENVVGYRVGRSRGKVDPNGRRTEFSNHSFGTAIDINAEHNGLYAGCMEFGPGCRLIRGGEWNPKHPLSITRGSVVYRTLTPLGWKWGGEIQGKQKDFMHFSLTGY